MIRTSEKLNHSHTQSQKNSLARSREDMVEFRHYTKQVWSKIAGRELTESEVDQILEEFGHFLLVLSGENK